LQARAGILLLIALVSYRRRHHEAAAGIAEVRRLIVAGDVQIVAANGWASMRHQTTDLGIGCRIT
jgi:hypothetical protein